ncbi:MAG TPA: LPS export ABC transporter periplasmic protein LptC [Candidatus Krumholzibacteriaceae bacterium]
MKSAGTIRRILVGGLLIALVFAVSIFVLSCQGKNKGQGTLATADVPDQEFNDFTTAESDSGLVKWMLKAPVARVYNARRLLVTDTPHIEFFDKQGSLASVLTSDKGEYNQVTHDLTALGKVVVTSQEGYVLETESLVWVNGSGEIHSEDFVKFTRGNDVLTGYGLRADTGLRDVEIQRNVKGFLRDENGFLQEEIKKDESTGVKRGE